MSRDRKGLLLGLAIALIVVSVPAVGIFILDAMLDSARKIDLVAGVLQGYVTVVAIMAGGAFAIYRLRIFRTLEPHIAVSHTMSYRVVGDSYVHIFVTAVLHNGSRVEVGIQEATFALQMISPMTDFAVEVFSAEASERRKSELYSVAYLERGDTDLGGKRPYNRAWRFSFRAF